MLKVFISYSFTDIEFAKQLASELRIRELDLCIEPGTLMEWGPTVRDAIDEADAFILVMSLESVQSENCLSEHGFAVDNDKQVFKILLVPTEDGSIPQYEKLGFIVFDPKEGVQGVAEKVVKDIKPDTGPKKSRYRPGAGKISLSPAETGIQPGKYFISHSYGDAPVRDQLLQQLPTGIEPFVFPPITVSPSEFVSNHLIDAILACDGMIYLKGGKSSESFWVAFERDFAIRNGKPVYSADPETFSIERDLSAPLDLAIFATYSSKNLTIVKAIIDFMRKERHFDVWIDREKLQSGENWGKQIRAGMKEHLYRGGYQVVFLTKASAESKYVQREIEQAFDMWEENLSNNDNRDYNGTVFARLEHVDRRDLPDSIRYRLNLHMVRLDTNGDQFNANHADDLIVRLYWLIYQNTNGKGLESRK